VRFEASADGLINGTFLATVGADVVGVLQRLNTGIFRPVVHDDIEAVTAHLASKGLVTPRLVPTRAGALWAELDEGVFRVLTPVGRRTIHRLGTLAEAESAGALVGSFHRAVADLDWEFRHVRAGAHDTDRHVAGMVAAVDANPGHRLYDDVAPLADAIAARWARWDGPRDLPSRVIHGDLKVSNLRFEDDVAVALIDLDTFARGTLDVELGDALRSWCNRASEDSVEAAFDVDVFRAALRGYARTGDATPEEWASIAPGVERIATELAARFAKDALEESYFGFNPKFGTRGDHNLLRARGQISLADAVSSFRGRRG
jgi:Ser/Thr protein kinase RdoA (MazF antagonist)